MAHYEFHGELRTMIEKHTPSKLNVEELFESYIPLLEKEDQGLETIYQSDLTAKIAQKNEERGTLYSGIYENVRSLTKHFSPSIVESAERLKIIFRTYGNISKRSYNEATASIDNLTAELMENHYKELNTCHLLEWTNILKQSNEDFRNLMKKRNEETAQQRSINMRELRAQIDKIYRMMTERIEASALLNGEEDYKDFIAEVNNRISYYKEYNI
ncbi:MAG: hypothetical protein CSB06_01445 [Bacteroidia bacterium]|nr:MAG: hypothetical protein CSB06_01445 [Bacteroidia bacterium]